MGGDDGYQISRSVRLRSSVSAYFNRTSGSPTNASIFTHSFWVKRGALSANQALIAGARPTNFDRIYFTTTDTLLYQWNDGTSNLANLETTQVFRDPSAWYHFVFVTDTTQATPANRVKIYVNGVQITAFSSTTYPTQSSTSYFNTNAVTLNIGRSTNASMYFDGYLTEINFIDGQALTPTSFGAFDAVTGVWNPKKYSGTYGTNGFYLNFSDNTSPASATTIGKDSSGNGNNWTPTSISLTTGTTYDSMVDSPTNYGTDTGVGGSVRGNYATLNPLANGTAAFVKDGNLRINPSDGNFQPSLSTIGVSSGKWYAECTVTNVGTGFVVGISKLPSTLVATNYLGNTATSWGYYGDGTNARLYNNSSFTSYGATYTTGAVIGVALDMDAGTLVFYRNGASQGTAVTGLSGTYAIGASPAGSAGIADMNYGQRAFSSTAPSGYKALCTQNLPTATVSNGANYMAASLYTGSASTQSVSNAVNSVSFQPDLVWVKDRSTASTQDNKLTDSVRGVTKGLISNTTGAETTDANGVTAFNTNGFSLGTGTRSYSNSSGDSYVGWQWKGGGTATNIAIGQYGTSPNIPSIASSVSANTTAGFSVVTYTGTGAAGTVGHGLGVAPSMIIIKSRDNVGGARDWYVYNSVIGNTNFLQLDTTLGSTPDSGTLWNSTSPTQYVFSLNTSGAVNVSTGTYVAYCFTPIAGYSAFGSYTGNSAADGAFIYCGFRPRYILHKASSTTSQWMIWDTARNTYNVLTNAELLANSANGEGVGAWGVEIDILSNGFKFRGFDNANFNYSGVTYIYAAFAENPFTISRAR
jgi:hypothetical protein